MIGYHSVIRFYKQPHIPTPLMLFLPPLKLSSCHVYPTNIHHSNTHPSHHYHTLIIRSTPLDTISYSPLQTAMVAFEWAVWQRLMNPTGTGGSGSAITTTGGEEDDNIDVDTNEVNHFKFQ